MIDGENFLKAISKALGNVAVQGGTDKQFSDPGMEGLCVRCDAHVCRVMSRTAENFWGADFREGDEFWEHHEFDQMTEEIDRALFEKTLAVADARSNLMMTPTEKRHILRNILQKFSRKK
ncbi:MAG: hypothetical protein FJ267_13570 [Planctomycetes bacterium]|nr:hypothetical protein [Planctomycetota bacterium]